MSPRVSVVVAVYKGDPFLAEALDSARAQTIPDIELIVVDDGSTDTSAEVAQRHSCGVTGIRQPNQGPASARNQGVAAARGEYLAFLDADDLWPQGRLAWQLECFAQHPRTDMVQGRLQSFRKGDSGLEVLGHPHHARIECLGHRWQAIRMDQQITPADVDFVGQSQGHGLTGEGFR